MKRAVAAIAVLLIAGVVPAVAEEGRVSETTLSALGLGGMNVISDAQGMEVRGMSSSAMSMGTSLVFGQLIDPETKSFVVGSDINTAAATAENAGKNIASAASHSQSSSLALQLDVVTLTSLFAGSLSGATYGVGLAAGH